MSHSTSRPVAWPLALLGAWVCHPAIADTPPADAGQRGGNAVIITGTAPICKNILHRLARDSGEIRDIEEGGSLGWRNVWDDAAARVADWHTAAAIREAGFDFDNDGVADRVDAFFFASRYMTGTTLLVTLGRPGKPLPANETDYSDSRYWLLPCQWDRVAIAVEQCPAFSQAFDEAGFDMPTRREGRNVRFRARYSTAVPIRNGGETYVVVTGNDEASQDYTAVLKPLPHRQFERTCLLRSTLQDDE